MVDFLMWISFSGIAVLAVVMTNDEIQRRTKRKRIERMTGPGEWPEDLDYGNKDVAL